MRDLASRDARLTDEGDGMMRTTISLADDVAAAVAQLRREKAIGLSEAVNELVRQGLRGRAPGTRFRQRSQRLGMLIDVTNVADAIEVLEGPSPG